MPATGGSSPFGSAAQPQFLPVEEAYPLGLEATGDHSLRLVWQMPPGYYLYQHAFAFTHTPGAGAASSARESLELSTEFPPALTREDEFFGVVQVYYDSVELALTSPLPLASSELSVTSQGCADAGLCYPPRTQHFRIDASGAITEFTIGPGRTAATRDTGTNPASRASLSGLITMALLAFAGGLILNLMPCVLPILSLKALSFANCEPAQRHRHGWWYSAGVLSSFLAVAALFIGLRGAGSAIGWGFQLQSPGFVVALGYLFALMGLSLSGVFQAGAGLMNLGTGLTTGGGHRGSFFTGVLAVVVASPCTAPFMGTALGFAITQPAPLALLIFAALGAGMAAPLLLLSYSETARRRLPRPGAWMETLKQALAFPLYATALWLFWVAGRQLGVDLMAAALLGTLLLALALWLWGGRTLARGAAVACVAGAVALALWRPAAGLQADRHLPPGAVPYSAQRLAQLRGAGQPVFVDVTADWCITCLANEKAVLSQDAVRSAFSERGITYMVADWTEYDAEIAAFVQSHGRGGIPLYVIYGANPAVSPQILPQILRAKTVLAALETAAIVKPAASELQVANAQEISR